MASSTPSGPMRIFQRNQTKKRQQNIVSCLRSPHKKRNTTLHLFFKKRPSDLLQPSSIPNRSWNQAGLQELIGSRRARSHSMRTACVCILSTAIWANVVELTTKTSWVMPDSQAVQLVAQKTNRFVWGAAIMVEGAGSKHPLYILTTSIMINQIAFAAEVQKIPTMQFSCETYICFIWL